MYRLVIVSGPNRGSSYTLNEGRNTIGRQNDSNIVLSSGKVSKLHCTLFATQDSVDLLDEGSTNGTFVNGTLTRKQPLRPGDKIGVGDFVMELVKVGGQAYASNVSSIMVHPSRTGNSGLHQVNGNLALSMPTQPAPSFVHVPQAVQAPEDPVGKIKFLFEGKLMPIFYGHLLKTEYKVLVSFLIGAVVLAAVAGSVTPVLNIATNAIEREAQMRAKTVAREVADRYLPIVSSGNTSQIDLSVLENDENVRMAAIVNLDMQIIAPQSRLGQILAGGKEASFALYAAKKFKAGEERPVSIVSNDIAIAVEPLKVIDVRQVKSQIAGMVIVSIDFSRNMLNEGGMAIAYSMALVIAGLVGVLVYFILLRLTFKPFQVLNDDLDQVLRGELPKVTHEFKIAELNNLWENINSAVVRGAKSSSSGFNLDSSEVNWDHETASVRAMSEASGYAFIAFDSSLKVIGLNSHLDEVMGIRMDALGQALQNVARDMAFTALVNDLKDRVHVSPSRSALEDSEFAGVQYQVIGIGVGPVGNSGLALVFKRKG